MAEILDIVSFEKQRATVLTSIVLRRMENGELVTHYRNDEDGSHFWGHYFSDEKEARRDFTARVALMKGAFGGVSLKEPRTIE